MFCWDDFELEEDVKNNLSEKVEYPLPVVAILPAENVTLDQ